MAGFLSQWLEGKYVESEDSVLLVNIASERLSV